MLSTPEPIPMSITPALIFAAIIVPAVFIDAYRHWLLSTLFDFAKKTVLPAFILYLFQLFFLNFFFGSKKNLKRRSIFNWWDFITMFFYVFPGFIVCVYRIAISLLRSIVFFCRLDTSLLSRQHEHYDAAYSAFISMLLMDEQFNNPVGSVFTELIESTVKAQNIQSEYYDNNSIILNVPESSESTLIMPTTNVTHIISKRNIRPESKIRAISRWNLAITLHNNPALIEMRKIHFNDGK